MPNTTIMMMIFCSFLMKSLEHIKTDDIIMIMMILSNSPLRYKLLLIKTHFTIHIILAPLLTTTTVTDENKMRILVLGLLCVVTLLKPITLHQKNYPAKLTSLL